MAGMTGTAGQVIQTMSGDELLHGGFAGRGAGSGNIEDPARDPTIGNGDGEGVEFNAPPESHMDPPSGAYVGEGGGDPTLTKPAPAGGNFQGTKTKPVPAPIHQTYQPLEPDAESKARSAKWLSDDQKYTATIVKQSAENAGYDTPESARAAGYNAPLQPNGAPAGGSIGPVSPMKAPAEKRPLP